MGGRGGPVAVVVAARTRVDPRGDRQRGDKPTELINMSVRYGDFDRRRSFGDFADPPREISLSARDAHLRCARPNCSILARARARVEIRYDKPIGDIGKSLLRYSITPRLAFVIAILRLDLRSSR